MKFNVLRLTLMLLFVILMVSVFGSNASMSEFEQASFDQGNKISNESLILPKDSQDPGYQIINEAVNYFRNLDDLQSFFIDHPDMILEGYMDYYNNIQVYGYDTSYSTYIYGSINYSQNEEGTFSFNINSIDSNSIYGSPNLDFEDVQTLAESNEWVDEFTSLYPEQEISIRLVHSIESSNYTYSFTGYRYYISYGYYGGGYVDEGQMTSEPYYYSYQWLSLAIDGDDGTIYEIHGTTIHNLTIDEVTSIILNFTEFEPILQTDYEFDLYFDGYGYWSVYLYNADGAYAYAWIDDNTSEIGYHYVFIPIPATRTEVEVEVLVKSLPEIQNWMMAVSNYESYVYYDQQGTWWVYLYDPVIYNNWVYVELDDANGTIVSYQVNLTEPPSLSENDLFKILRQVGLEEFYTQYPDSQLYYAYDGYGTWYIYVYSITLIEAYRSYEIDDTSGEITLVYESNPQIMPSLSTIQVEQIITTTEEYLNFTNQYEITGSWIYYYDGVWYAQYEGLDGDGIYRLLTASIDDKTGEINEISINQYYWIWLEDDINPGAENDMSQYGPNSNRDEGIPLGIIFEDDETSNGNLSASFLFISMISGLAVIVGMYRTKKFIR